MRLRSKTSIETGAKRRIRICNAGRKRRVKICVCIVVARIWTRKSRNLPASLGIDNFSCQCFFIFRQIGCFPALRDAFDAQLSSPGKRHQGRLQHQCHLPKLLLTLFDFFLMLQKLFAGSLNILQNTSQKSLPCREAYRATSWSCKANLLKT